MEYSVYDERKRVLTTRFLEIINGAIKNVPDCSFKFTVRSIDHLDVLYAIKIRTSNVVVQARIPEIFWPVTYYADSW